MSKSENKKSTKAKKPVALAEISALTVAGKPQLVRLGSKTIPGFWFKIRVEIAHEFGIPNGPDGHPLFPTQAVRGGMSAEERAERKVAKEKEVARVEAMSDEDRLAYAKEKKAVRQKARMEKQASARVALLAQIKAETQAGVAAGLTAEEAVEAAVAKAL